MAGSLLTDVSLVVCDHGGRASPIAAAPRVRVMGRPVIVADTAYAIVDCPLPAAAGGPCVTGGFVTFARRVTASGAPLRVVQTQDRVRGQ